MTDRFVFWTHGVTAMPKYDKKGLAKTLTEDGANFRQPKDANIFLLPIPSASMLDDCSVEIREAWLRADVSSNAIITNVDLYQARRDGARETVEASGVISITGQKGEFRFDVEPNVRCTGPVTMAVTVAFEAPANGITFNAAGVRFEEL